MEFNKLSQALNLSDPDIVSKVESIQTKLEAIPDSFYAAFWLYTHDFLFISKSIETVLGHTYEKFTQYGMVFFQNIVPPRLINPIFETMNAQAAQIEKHPEYILAKEFLHINAAVINSEMEEVPVTYNALLLDSKPFTPTSYLVLCSWVDQRNKKNEEIQDISIRIKTLFLEIKELYIKSKPEHFKLLLSSKNISDREKQVAKLIMQGHSTKNISDLLQITFHTVESHRKNLLEKLSAKNTAELVHKLGNITL